jgi:hypothetical protein
MTAENSESIPEEEPNVGWDGNIETRVTELIMNLLTRHLEISKTASPNTTNAGMFGFNNIVRYMCNQERSGPNSTNRPS